MKDFCSEFQCIKHMVLTITTKALSNKSDCIYLHMTHKLIVDFYISLNLILFDFTASYNIFTSKNNSYNHDSMRANVSVLIWVWEGHASQAEPFHFISRHKSPAGRKKNNEEQASLIKYAWQFEHSITLLAIIVQCAADILTLLN